MSYDVIVVRDATADERFQDNPLVTGSPDIRFYAGAPLVTPDGHALGSLCTIDRRPRELSTDQEVALKRLARQVMRLIEARRVSRKLARVLEEMVEVKKHLVPICCHCKGVRDDEGFWNQLEAYMEEHSDFQFSHGLCPDCLEKLYPEQAERVPGKDGSAADR